MIRRFTSAQFIPADAGSKDKNPMGSTLLSTPIIAPTNLDGHQILRNFCHESVHKGLRFFADRAAKKWPLAGQFEAGVERL
jgi:hypothetical protein